MILRELAKRIACCAVIAFSVFISEAYADLFVYEGFDYDATSPALDGRNGGVGWGTEAWVDSSPADFALLQTGSLQTSSPTWPGLPGPLLGNRIEGLGVNTTTTQAIAERKLPAALDFSVNNTVFYLSFLIKKTSTAASQNNLELILRDSTTSTSTQQVRFGSTTANAFFMNMNNTGTVTGESSTPNQTFFVVLKGVSSAASPDQFFANVYNTGTDSDKPPLSEPVTWEITQSTSASFKLDVLRLAIGKSASGAFDEIRIGDTWASVTTTVVPEGSSLVLCLLFTACTGLLQYLRRV